MNSSIVTSSIVTFYNTNLVVEHLDYSLYFDFDFDEHYLPDDCERAAYNIVAPDEVIQQLNVRMAEYILNAMNIPMNDERIEVCPRSNKAYINFQHQSYYDLSQFMIKLERMQYDLDADLLEMAEEALLSDYIHPIKVSWLEVQSAWNHPEMMFIYIKNFIEYYHLRDDLQDLQDEMNYYLNIRRLRAIVSHRTYTFRRLADTLPPRVTAAQTLIKLMTMPADDMYDYLND